MHYYNYYWEYKGICIIECTTCGFKHIHPIPSKKEIKAFYQQYYEKNKPFDYSIVTGEFVNETIDQVFKSEENRRIYKMVDDLKKTPLKVMLDVGAGNNLLAKYFQLKGWEVKVNELNKNASEFLKAFGLNVFNNTVEEFDFTRINRISFLNVQFVLEHLRNPIQFLEKAYKYIVPGGIIRICVPNDFSAGQMAYKEYGSKEVDWIVVPDHINYFDFNSLSNLLTRIGFLEVYRRTNFPLEFLLLGGIDYYSCPDDQKKVSTFVSKFENSFRETNRSDQLEKLYKYIAKAGFGRSIYLYAQKPLSDKLE